MIQKKTGLPRRDFLKKSAVAGASLALASRANRTFAITKQSEKPNILWIMSDEHNANILGCYGNKISRTPHMDSLAENGIAFDSCYCNSPLCVPSRASITSGKYISRVSVWNNDCELPTADIPSLPRVLNAAGYESYLCGKQHYDYSRRYGFTEVGGNFNKSFKTGHGSRRAPNDLSQNHLSERFSEFHTGEHGSSVVHDIKVTNGALDFLKNRRAGEKPFFLWTGYIAPHFPLIVPEEFYQHYKGKIELPEIPPGHLDQLPLNYKHLRAGFKVMNVPADTVRKGRELYYGLTEWIDGKIGEVLATLRANQAIADNTVVIYASDHGENMGEHGLWWKNDMFEHASRVPLIVSWPKRFTGGQRRTQACSHLDLVQTVAEMGGGRTPDDWNGSSMLAWMDNPQTQWKDFALSEYYAHQIASGYTMMRSGKWKYTYHTRIDATHGPERQLFDLSSDAKEFHNLAADPQYTQLMADFDKRITKEVGEAPDDTEHRARREFAKGYHRTDKPPVGKKAKAEE